MILYYSTKSSKVKKKLLFGIFFSFILLVTIMQIHSFLSLNNPIRAEILVVEGWLDYDYMPIILEEFNRNNYNRIIVIGQANSASSGERNDKHISNAELRAMQLRLLSNYTINICTVNSKFTEKNKTWNYMIGFKNWLIRELPDTKSLNLISPSVHARKSFIILRRILPRSINVGIISAPALTYNAKYWWLSERGLWLVFKNAISYIYALLFSNCQNIKC